MFREPKTGSWEKLQRNPEGSKMLYADMTDSWSVSLISSSYVMDSCSCIQSLNLRKIIGPVHIHYCFYGNSGFARSCLEDEPQH